MNARRLLSTLLFTICALLSAPPPTAAQQEKPDQKADPRSYGALRNLALTVTRTELELPQPESPKTPWGVLMDTAFDEGGTVTVIAFADGTASIYLSSGGGYIGGDSDTKIRKAVQQLLATAKQYQPESKPAATQPLPAKGRTVFYFRTDSGIYTAEAAEGELANGKHRLSPLFLAVQKVITEYRLLSESGTQPK